MLLSSLKAIVNANKVEISTSYPTPNQLYTLPHGTHDSLLRTMWSVTDLLHKFILDWLDKLRVNPVKDTSFIVYSFYP